MLCWQRIFLATRFLRRKENEKTTMRRLAVTEHLDDKNFRFGAQ